MMKKAVYMLLGLVFLWSYVSCENGSNKHVKSFPDKTETPDKNQASQKAGSEESGDLYVADSVIVRWTAYKTTAKVPVSGTFVKTGFKLHSSASTPLQLLEKAYAKLETASVFSGNEERDGKLRDYFFRKMIETANIEVRTAEIVPSKSMVKMVVRMNNREVPVNFYVKIKENSLSGEGDIDMVKMFDAADALSALHGVCAQQHTGPDGISKTWPDVHLHFRVYYHKKSL
ncbi:MAG: hypothetical protein GXO24_01665 [Chlorobi bacterium]|nr:hypothetical protein [Chlorobiota bacterium]